MRIEFCLLIWHTYMRERKENASKHRLCTWKWRCEKWGCFRYLSLYSLRVKLQTNLHFLLTQHEEITYNLCNSFLSLYMAPRAVSDVTPIPVFQLQSSRQKEADSKYTEKKCSIFLHSWKVKGEEAKVGRQNNYFFFPWNTF